MLDAHRRRLDRRPVRRHPRGRAPRPPARPARRASPSRRSTRTCATSPRATSPPRTRCSFLGAGHVRPLRPGADRLDPAALGVPDAVHALPARDLPGRAAGDVRVPDGDLRADRPAGLQRVASTRARAPSPPPAPRPARTTGTPRFLVSRGVHPHRRETLATTLAPAGARRSTRSRCATASPTPTRWPSAVDDDVGAVFLQQPNFLGAVEDLEALAARRQGDRRAARSSQCDPLTLGVLRPPGEFGVDIAVGEGQTLGNRLDFGGPSFGFFAAQRGATCAACPAASPARRPTSTAAAASCSRCRRASSTSAARRRPHNICTAQALNALAGVIYLSWLGRRGIVELGELLLQRTALRARDAGRARRRRRCCTSSRSCASSRSSSTRRSTR